MTGTVQGIASYRACNSDLSFRARDLIGQSLEDCDPVNMAQGKPNLNSWPEFSFWKRRRMIPPSRHPSYSTIGTVIEPPYVDACIPLHRDPCSILAPLCWVRRCCILPISFMPAPL
jgi:hypothetical protein